MVWLEVLKLVVSALTPIAVVVLGVKLNQRLKDLEQKQWRSRKLIEKRIELYDQISPALNDIYCYFMWVGEWKKSRPIDIISKKRTLDRQIHIYRYLLPKDFYDKYQSFMEMIFSTYNGAGEDARLKTAIQGGDGNRRESPDFKWIAEWDQCFETRQIASKSQLREAYHAVMDSQQSGIELIG
ncbi:hypothetical protein [Devosia sp. RR2S18]|uniref:hypothetical protein n=1 Tax=Devosia rhizosphaerae TaxID=3049774 RepID=UPI00253FA094|nr:hypothetical protein [Devosia sp. RR2S18]WIJ24239.1 hypothetical protein QOV41_14620 [Devosia sp. RR2S18]